MNIVKSLVLSGLVVLSTPIAKQNEIVIKTAETKQSICEVAYHVYEHCELESNIIISWDVNSNESKHFSIERFIEGDINDAFIISKNKHEQGGFEWYTLDIEGWKDVDENWFEFRMGL